MGAAWMLPQWRRTVQTVFPDMHGHQLTALAAMSWGMCLARHCQFNRIASVLPGRAKLLSTERRWQRLVANERLVVVERCAQLAEALLRHWSGRRLALFVDETPLKGNWLYCLKVSVAYRKRALPLVWVCYRRGEMPDSQPALMQRLLGEVARCLPPNVQVTLMADRGLAWPVVIDICRALQWHFLLRVQGQTKVLLANHRQRCRIDQLVAVPKGQFTGSGLVFQQAGWRQANIVAVHDDDQRQPWLLITSLQPTRRRCTEYRRRMWQEQSFRDEKSHGFQWQQSQVRHPEHAERLLLAVALSMWLAIALGTLTIKRGLRRELEPPRRRTLSVFQLGLRWLHERLRRGQPPPITLRLYPASAKVKCVGS